MLRSRPKQKMFYICTYKGEPGKVQVKQGTLVVRIRRVFTEEGLHWLMKNEHIF